MDPLIRGLLRPEAYDHPTDALELLETHISWVILTGPYAYKLKKPVNFGFVDFTTLEQRRFCCEEELRLNRRLAEDLYLSVKPVFGPRDQASFVGHGQPIEFAVQMRQFPQTALLPAVLARGELTGALLDRLALDVARFQRTAAVADRESPYGAPDAVRAPVTENLRILSTSAVGPLAVSASPLRNLVERLRDWADGEFSRLAPVFAARKAEGFVREGHGDMHLGNMVLRDAAPPSPPAARGEPADEPRIEVFDCLEFNPALRWIDVISEVAFLVMDLADRGRRDLGWRFLNGWLEATGDYAGLHVWAWYYCYRALVRAKVAALRLGQADLTEAESARLSQQLGEYLHLGWQATQIERPRLVITSGVSGSGKSLFSQLLAAELGCIRLRSDVERRRLFADPSTRYAPPATAATYERLLELAKQLLENGFSVIVDAAFLRRAQRAPFRALAQSLQVPSRLIEFTAPQELLERRVAERNLRGHDPSEATVDVLRRQLREREPVLAEEGWHVLGCDTSLPDASARLLPALCEFRK